MNHRNKPLAAWLFMGAVSGSTIFSSLPLSFAAAPATTQAVRTDVGEKVPSEDSLVKDLHSLGLINGSANIFRCASPVRDLVKKGTSAPADPAAAKAEAIRRMKHLYDLGIRTIFSFEDPGKVDNDTAPVVTGDTNDGGNPVTALEKKAALEVGLKYISRPIVNSGTHSLEDMSDEEVMKLLDSVSGEILKEASAGTGGVIFHCSAGHDRTGIVTAYIRMKYEHWPVEQAIDEMRRLGHNWPKYSHNGGVSSWHEDHLRAIAPMLVNPN